MIPAELEAKDLRFDAFISEWKLEVMSTNWHGYWILQLTHRNNPPLALLIDLDNLAAIVRSVQSCINAARDPNSYPGAKTMYVTAATGLPTQSNDEGAVTVLGEWKSEPFIVLNYFRGGHGEGTIIRQALAVDDAMRLSDLFAVVYNECPHKESWKARIRA